MNKNRQNNSYDPNQYRPAVLWLTGLPGAGKSTIAERLKEELFFRHINSYVLDGDRLRSGLSSDLGYSKEEREEHLRRSKEVAKLFYDAGLFVICAFISPFAKTRKEIRESFNPGEFIEVFVDCPSAECEKRDPKGLYSKFRRGEVKNLTGVSAPYEIPKNPELHLHTNDLSIDQCIEKIIEYLVGRGALQASVSEKPRARKLTSV